MSNLKEETLRRLSEEGYGPEDVESVQGKVLRISLEHFMRLADVDYDAGYGAPEVARDLTILMKDGAWFTREEYDGSEWWRCNRRPARIEEISDDKVNALVCGPEQVGWCDLLEVNEPQDADERPSEADIEALDAWCIERKIKWNVMGSEIELIFGPHMDLAPDWTLQLRRVDGCLQYAIIDDDGAVVSVAADMPTALDLLSHLIDAQEDGDGCRKGR